MGYLTIGSIDPVHVCVYLLLLPSNRRQQNAHKGTGTQYMGLEYMPCSGRGGGGGRGGGVGREGGDIFLFGRYKQYVQIHACIHVSSECMRYV